MSKITIIGAGILSPNQITLEADEALRQSDIVFYLLDVNAGMRRYLQGLKKQLVDLDPIYREGRLDVDVYSEITSLIVSAGAARNSVALMVPGHPGIYVAVTKLIVERAAVSGIETAVLPGISSLDTMILQLGLEIGTRGVQIYEANRFVYYGIQPDPRVPLFLLQPGAIGSAILTHKTASKGKRFEVLKEALLKVYPENHSCVLLISQHKPTRPALKREIPIVDIPRHWELLDYDTSLFVWPVADFQVTEREFYDRLTQPKYATNMLNHGRRWRR